MIQKRKREELYDKFRQGAVPSGADFADMIRSQVNLLDDGIDVSENPDDPIVLRAHGMKENLLDFADQDNRRRWRISGRCEDESKEGLNIKADEKSRLYIERESGNVGVSTDQPAAKLHIIQTGATDILRIDDEGNDETPLVVTSEGNVGIGLENPGAKLHVGYYGTGDILRVDDTEQDTTPFIIKDTGDVCIGCDSPEEEAKLTVHGGVCIGEIPENDETGEPETALSGNSLYVEGNIEVGGSVVFSGGSGVEGIEINAPLTSETKEVTIKDNLKIIADPEQPGSDGNLSVAGDTTLGTFNKVPGNQNEVTINGRIRSGSNPQSGEEQYELVVNDILTLNRDTNSPQAEIRGSLTVLADTVLGNEQSDQIKLNGVVSSETGGVIINDDLDVTKKASIKTASIDELMLQSGVTANEISNDPELFDNSASAIPTEQAVKGYIDQLLVGSITAFAMETPPEGWLECNGRAISRTSFSRLFAKIGTRFGAGNGSTTFNLPDLRNEFIRGWDHTRSLGSKQASAFQDHRHDFNGTLESVSSNSHNHVNKCGGAYTFKKGIWGKTTVTDYNSNGKSNYSSHNHSFRPSGTITNATSGNRDSNETRPQNMALMYCIKY